MTPDRSVGSGGDGLLEVVADPDCRAILETTAEAPRTVSELVEACDIPVSTAYRKVDALVDVGLLEDSIRIRTGGRDATEYSLRVERISIDLTNASPGDAGDAVDASAGEPDWGPAFPDGGTTDDSRQGQLRTLFRDVTGTDTLVEEQEDVPASRFVGVVDPSSTETLPEYVTALAKADGLAGVLDGAGYVPD